MHIIHTLITEGGGGYFEDDDRKLFSGRECSEWSEGGTIAEIRVCPSVMIGVLLLPPPSFQAQIPSHMQTYTENSGGEGRFFRRWRPKTIFRSRVLRMIGGGETIAGIRLPLSDYTPPPSFPSGSNTLPHACIPVLRSTLITGGGGYFKDGDQKLFSGR